MKLGCVNSLVGRLFGHHVYALEREQWRRQDFLLEGQKRTGSGVEPQNIFLGLRPLI